MLRRRFFLLLVTTFSALLWGSSVCVAADSADGGALYTTVNLWYEKPQKIFPLFHKGTMIKVGTKVTVTNTSSKVLEFEKGGVQFRIYSSKYYNMSGDEMAKQIFSSSNLMAKGGKFSKFNDKEQKAIKGGRLVVGMSRDAAIMAYGYPPTHVNPDINAERWELWQNRWNRLIVNFKDNKISSIQD